MTVSSFGLDCNCFEPFETSINGTACFVAVQDRTWSDVKDRYREE
jgi:hypothetical protein